MTTYAPSPWDGATVAFLTDMHAGRIASNGISLTTAQHNLCGQDIDYLSRYCDAIALAGDNVNWTSTDQGPEDSAITSWLNARTLPAVVASGNHDLANSTTYAHRTGNVWANASGRAKFEQLDVGDSQLQLVALSQESMRFNEWLMPSEAALDDRPEVKPGRGYVITDNPLNPFDVTTGAGFLRTQLETGRPTWLVQHYPMRAHVTNSRFVPQATETLLDSILADYSNMVGVLSGHHHPNLATWAHVGRQYVSAGRMLAGCCGPAAGGSDAFNAPFIATVVSYRPGRVVVRWRDLMRRSWIRSGVYGFASEFEVSCTAPL